VTRYPPPLSGLKIVQFDPSGTQAQFLALMKDMTIDVIEMRAGTYHLGGQMVININRSSRPLTIRPAAGATVIFEGDQPGAAWGQFYFGDLGGQAAYITMEGFIFDGYTLAGTAVVWVGNAHHITLNNMTVRNTTAAAGHQIYIWALYISYDNGVAPQNITADNWTVLGNGTFSAYQVGQPVLSQHIHASGWTVAHCAFAIYAYNLVSDLVIDNWTISDTTWSGVSVHFGVQTTGTFSNIHGTSSGGLVRGAMTDGSGNSWQ
jgi:hypothetical protein